MTSGRAPEPVPNEDRAARFRASTEALLEVIALGPEDAERAQKGGADRLELVTDMAVAGLTPSAAVVREVLGATDLPVRVMLRAEDSFRPVGLDGLRSRAADLAEAGAAEFVFGFLTPGGEPDLAACRALAESVPGCRWTFHRAVDHAADPRAAHAMLVEAECDTVLTAGHPEGVERGRTLLRELAARREGPRLLAGGGLRAEHIAPLRAAGVTAFHVGGAVRQGGWTESLDAEAVRRWAELVSSS
ncbi:copper homeostasis protein [Amycolatopsis cihanbeyliensis]|uniref:Copper homeostasis protein cutC homolog n=1 Tax=Amycolatopsis cihanbeyliensis TaxID=1128664 RepID=A0A542DIK5_AMYCI|nr:copper homeostasis protein [Amycolatopsis cihanbeyliensis]